MKLEAEFRLTPEMTAHQAPGPFRVSRLARAVALEYW